MGFIEGLPKSEGWDTIFVVENSLRKYSHFIGLKHPFTAPMVIVVFANEVMHLHGIPRSIFYDRDKVFLLKIYSKLGNSYNFLLHRSYLE